jgi:sigma-B regulation protein RsbU (phosphoserine phosphatase)
MRHLAKSGDHKYATAIVLSFHRIMGWLAFSNAGHLPPLWYHAAQRAWGWLEEGTEAKKVSGSDLLVLYTDGITEAGNETGQELGREQLLEWVRQAPVDSPRALGEDLLQRLELFRGKLRNDDETLLVLQREKESRLFMLREVANSFTFGRLLRSKQHKLAKNQPA